MRRRLLIYLFSGVVLSATFFELRAEGELPDLVLQSLQLLKKPIEELLPDLDEEESDEATTQAVESTSLKLQAFQDMLNERERWNQMRRLIEAGQPLDSPLPSEIAISTSPIGRLAPAVPPPPGFTVQLPYESRLTVSGRKTIGMTFRSTKYSNSNFATTQGVSNAQSAFELVQSLQVRINGQIGRKVTVNVDFDDTKTDKKDISIVYKGDPDEIVQKAAFGDINMALPQTEFAGYNKQVFGAMAELKYKALRGYFIGSRTKGQTETKEFTGNVLLQRINVPDTSYIRRRFYNYKALTSSTNHDNVSIPTFKVYIDDQTSNRSGSLYTTRTVDLTKISNRPGTAASTHTGLFRLMQPGIDYTVDPSSGVITFRNALTNISVVAVDYVVPATGQTLSSGNGGQEVAIKWDESVITTIPNTEELTHYNIGATKIVRDNGQGNFTLQLRDLGNNNIGPTVGVQYLVNNTGQIIVDFEAGTFVLTRRLDNNDPTSSFAPVYFFTPTTQSSFFVEYRARVKTYTLRPNIVINSERISLDDRVLVRDVDYFIDYASGFLTFFNEDQITETTRVRATYDFSPFGIAGSQQDTLVGARGEVSMAPVHPILASSLLGSSIIYNFAPKQTAAPDIRSTSGSWLVQEADIHFKDLIFNPLPLLKSSFSAEVARSVRNPNTFGKALIDNMEGIKDETTVSLSKLGWQISAAPIFGGGDTYLNAIGQVSAVTQPGDNLNNNLVRTLDINPNAAALSGDQTQVLSITYDLSVSSEAAIATVLRPGGIDFSKKQYLEMWMLGDGTAAGATPTETQLNVTLGQISEDFDGTASLKTEDANGNSTLDANEDNGVAFRNPDATLINLGANNLRIDSNDLDRNGVLNATENTLVGGNVGYDASASINPPIGDITFDSTVGANRVDFSGWKFVRVPLNISTNTANSWSAIKVLRLSLKMGGNTAARTGTIHIAKIAVVGNRWQTASPTVFGSTITVKAINTEDDASYVSPAGNANFDDLNQINTALTGPTPTRRKEQSLAINYAYSAASGTVLAKSVTVSPMDFTNYGSIRFFFRKNGAATTASPSANFLFRVGSDFDYWEFSIPINSVNLPADQWIEMEIRQLGSPRPSLWAAGTPNGSVRSQGNPNLSSVAQLTYGVENTAATTDSGEIWIDELYASDVRNRVGYASVFKSAFDVFGWGNVSGSARNLDRNFETFTSAITNQDRHEQNATMNLTRLAWFPMTFTGAQRHTITPAINTVNTTLVSFLQEGDVRDRSFGGSGTLQIPRLPKLGLAYDTNKIESSQIFRTDKSDRYGLTFDYTVPGTSRLLPRNIQWGYKLTQLKINYKDGALFNASDPFAFSDTRNDTHEVSAKMNFQPASGFTFNPSFSRLTTREEKDVIFSTNSSVNSSTTTLIYDKLKTQTMGLDGVLGIKRWFSPRLRYLITNRETYGIPTISNLSASDLKTVDRTGTGEFAWDFSWRDFSRRLRALQSMNVVSTYLMEDGDSWKDVKGGFDSLNSVSVRDALGSGTRTNLTVRETIRSTQRLSPFDWAAHWVGPGRTLRTMSLTSTISDTKQRQETTGTPTRIHTQILPDVIFGFTQTEHLFRAERWMSNSQMNLKAQYKKVDTENTSLLKSATNGGDWRFTMFRKLDLFTTYTRTSENTFDRVNNATTNKSLSEVMGFQLGFNWGKWRLSPKYDQTKRTAEDSGGRLTTDLRTRTAALQAYADLQIPAGIKLPFADLVVFSNRIRTTENISVEMRRSSIDELNTNTDTYRFSTSNDYEMTSNVRLTFGGSYFYTANKVSSAANTYGYEINSLLTIQF